MTKFVLSTQSTSTKYQDHSTADGGMLVVNRTVMVRGGANLASLSGGFGEMTKTEEGTPIWTPRGVVTPVSDEDAEFLQRHPVFIAEQKAGFVMILDKAPGNDHDKITKIVAAELNPRDGSAPLTKETFKTQVKVSLEKVE